MSSLDTIRIRLSSLYTVHDKLLSSNAHFRQQTLTVKYTALQINHLYNYTSLIIHIKSPYFQTENKQISEQNANGKEICFLGALNN